MDEDLKKYVSMAALMEEDADQEGYNPEADANAALPVLVKGDYLGIVRYLETDPEKRWPSGKEKDPNSGELVPTGKPPVTKDGKKYMMTEVEIELHGNADESVNGRRFRDRVSTLVRAQAGTTRIQALLQGCGVTSDELATAKSIKGQVALLDQYLESGDTICGVHLEWEASYYRKDVMDEASGRMGMEFTRVRGMKRFPLNPAYDPAVAGSREYLTDYPFSGLVVNDVPVDELLPARNVIHHYVAPEAIGGEQVAEGADTVAATPQVVNKATTPAAPVVVKPAGGPPVPASAAAAPTGRRPAVARRA